jgi:5'-methylthioadenosine phosphorylase
MDKNPVMGIIGGSGLYSMPNLRDTEEMEIETPFGNPSSKVLTGTLNGTRLAFLARHGNKHQFTPSKVNYRANIYALKSIGVSYVLAVSACGSLKETFEPGHIVVPDQLFDLTKGRKPSFFEEGIVAHVGVAKPYCNQFRAKLSKSCQKAGATVHDEGTYITVEGPRFSSKAESEAFRSWGMSIIGMTTAPEAFLAREAELHYAVMAHVTDYDVWHDEEVSVEIVVERMKKNLNLAQKSIENLVEDFDELQSCECNQALENAFLTQLKDAPKTSKEKLGIIIEKYI